MINSIDSCCNIMLLLTLFYMFGSMHVNSLVNAVAIQGVVLAIAATLFQVGSGHHAYIVPILVLFIKGILFPLFLKRAIMASDISLHLSPLIRPIASILIGIAGLLLTILVCSYLKFPPHIKPNLYMTQVAIFTIFSGLFFIVARRLAFSQIVGYITFENGIFLLGMALGLQQNYLLEVALVLDVFVFVFISGLIAFHINTSYNDIHDDKHHLRSDSLNKL